MAGRSGSRATRSPEAPDEREALAAPSKPRPDDAVFRAVFHASAAAMTISRVSDGRLIELNDAACQLLGYERDEILGKTAEEIGLLADIEAPEDYQAHARQGKLRNVEIPFRRRSGELAYGSLSASLIDVDGQPCLLSVVIDVTRQHAAEEAVRASEAKFAAAFNSAGVMMVITTLTDSRIVDVNRAFLEQSGFTREEVIGKTADDLGVYASPAEEARAAETLQRDGHIRNIDVQTIHRSGEIRHTLLSADIVELDGTPHLVTAAVDNTSRWQAAEALRASEERYRGLFEQTADGVIVLDEEGRILDLNPALAALLGRSRDEARGTHWTDYVDNLGEVPYVQPQILGGEPVIFERRLRRPDGSVVEVECTARWVGRGWMLGTLREIGVRKAAERERARLIRAIDQSADSIMITDRDGRIEYVNPTLERTAGLPRDQLIGANHRVVLGSDALPDSVYAEIVDIVGREGHWSGEISTSRPDGRSLVQQVTLTAVIDDSGGLANYVVALRDVTHEHQLEDQLRQAQKMEAIGRLAGGVAHDFNNLLTAITGFTELAAVEAPPKSELAEDLAEIRRSADRASSLTRQLLAFSRRAVISPEALDLSRVVTDVAPMLERIIGENVALEIHSEGHLGRVLADRGQIEQVIVNLAVNARDAMPRGGTLTITTAQVELDEAYAAEHPEVRPGQYLRLSFADTGTGMDAATLEHIFEPFFTTKETGSGTGLGLATVFGIVRQSGGYVGVRSSPGAGSTFLIDLPVTEADQAHSEAAPAAAPVSGHETVLVVEDEPSVLGFAARLLGRNGYEVLQAANGDEAVRLAKRYSGPIDLVFCDLVMPGLTGQETASAIRSSRPRTRALFASGYSESVNLGTADDRQQMPFIAKPYDGDTLLRAVRQALARR